MTVIPFGYEMVNRNAVVIKPKQPFFDWLNATETGDSEPITSLDENNVYLVRNRDDNDQVRRWVKKHFEPLFANELNDWSIDESVWPQNRTYQMFTEWFHVEVHSMVLDLEAGPLDKEADY